MTRGLVCFVLYLPILLLAAGCDPSRPVTDAATTAATVPAAGPTVERGAYLVSVLGCGDCHTPLKMGPNGPEPDSTRALSGHPGEMTMPPPPTLGDSPWGWVGGLTNTAFAGPWGISYSTNITPDETSGLGPWTEEMFVKAIKTGKHWGEGRGILPPMPWTSYRNMTDGDVKSVWAYLKTVPAVKNNPPASEPAARAATAAVPVR